MAIFSRNKEEEVERERLLGQRFTGLRYSTLEEAVLGEFDLGSQSSKLLTINFPGDRVVTLLSHNDTLVFVQDSTVTLDMASFTYWLKVSSQEKGKALEIFQHYGFTPKFFMVLTRRNAVLFQALRRAAHNMSLENLLWLRRNFSSYTTLDTEIYGGKQELAAVAEMNVGFQELDTVLDKLEEERATATHLLGIKDFDYSQVRLGLKGSTRATDPETLFVTAAADAEATLEDMKAIAQGFLWGDILRKVFDLSEDKVISVTLEAPLMGLPDDFEIVRPYEKLFRLTKNLELDLVPLVGTVFDLSSDRDLALKLAEKNKELEGVVLEMENQLIAKLAKEKYNTFEELPEELQTSVRFIILERRKINNLRKRLLERLGGLVVTDTQTQEDNHLRTLIEQKLRGLLDATDVVPDFEEPHEESAFDLTHEEPKPLVLKLPKVTATREEQEKDLEQLKSHLDNLTRKSRSRKPKA